MDLEAKGHTRGQPNTKFPVYGGDPTLVAMRARQYGYTKIQTYLTGQATLTGT